MRAIKSLGLVVLIFLLFAGISFLMIKLCDIFNPLYIVIPLLTIVAVFLFVAFYKSFK